MDRKEFAEILNSIKISEKCDLTTIQQETLPIYKALSQIMPESLYRYRTCSDTNINAFENDKVYAVTSDMFNDPYDTLLKYDKNIVKKIFNSIFTKDVVIRMKEELVQNLDFPEPIKQYFKQDSIKKTIENFLSLKDEDIDSFITKRKNTLEYSIDLLFPFYAKINKRYFTISCFTETISSVIMWSHYANNHKGFALEYNMKPILSNRIPNISIYPVIYDNKRFDGTEYTMWEFLKFAGVNFPNQDLISHIKCALYKSKQWEYEKEWRLIDTTTRNNIMLDNTTSILLKPIAIYYGKNISLEDRTRLHHIASEKGIDEYDMYIDYESDKYEMLYRRYS